MTCKEKRIIANSLLQAGCIVEYNLKSPEIAIIKPDQVIEREKTFRQALKAQTSKPDPFLEDIRMINSVLKLIA